MVINIKYAIFNPFPHTKYLQQQAYAKLSNLTFCPNYFKSLLLQFNTSKCDYNWERVNKILVPIRLLLLCIHMKHGGNFAAYIIHETDL